MTQYEIYVFFLCLIVFILLTSLSVICLWIIARLSIRLIRIGAEDEKIIQEKSAVKKENRFASFLEWAVSGLVCAALLVVFICSVMISFSKDAPVGDLPVYRVVTTGSMAAKHSANQYLFDNSINNQIQAFDLIRTEKLPAEEDLQLYDIVVYKMDDILVVHRIVAIEEPNEDHPGKRYFLLQGDAVESPDRFPVLYEQMCAIYRGDRMPFIGSFILFMQSPAGALCMLLVLIAVIAAPLLDNLLQKERDKRYALIAQDLHEEATHV